MLSIELEINGETRQVLVEPQWTLLYVLRELLDLTGTKCGCNTGDCGACKVLIDDQAVNACLIQAHKAQGKHIETIEGFSGPNGKLHPIQDAFIMSGAVQCGFCTPGMIISTKALLLKNPNPNEDEIRQALDNNICRCTGYVKIVAAVKLAAQMIKE